MDKYKLIELHKKNTKHSNYQILPNALVNILDKTQLKIHSRHESERMIYFVSKVSFENKKILDIGANTGYFTFESIDAGASSVVVYEGNKNHAEFITEASKIVSYPILAKPEYYAFEEDNTNYYDVVLLLNIVHHLGDDYGDNSVNKENAKKQMLQCINKLSKNCEKMIFQMGFNWKGNRYDCLFDNGTKNEQIKFIEAGIESYWKIENIGVAEKENGQIVYKDLTEKNIKRDDTLGEFLNRPIIILKSLCYNG